MSDLCLMCPMPSYCQLQGKCDHTVQGERLNFMVTRAREMERERCAALCETLNHGAFGSSDFLLGVQTGAAGCAKAIRETP